MDKTATDTTCEWTGASGRKYKYWVFPISQIESPGFEKAPGNYIFAKHIGQSAYPIYVGQTGDLGERFGDHHKMPCIRRNGATHIHAHKSSFDEDVRKAEERDLIAGCNPPCNG
jgi:hypothetical protein